jgi:predicted RNase H-like nuclease (RuvC/YqgF family)
MFVDLPENLVLIAAAFLLGLLLATFVSSLTSGKSAKKRDPRDDRIRSLEAELRVAQSAGTKAQADLEKLQEELAETADGIERRDNVISDQQVKIERLSMDLKGSVLKTRELRAELTDRATANVHAEAKIREVETELSVAQASQDLIATGVLDYRFVPDEDDPDGEEAEVSGAAT